MKLPRFSLETFKSHGKRLQQEVRNQTLTYFTAALGFVAGLAWNEAIKALIETWFPAELNNVVAKLIYALTVTLVVVILTNYVVRTKK